MLAVVWWGGGLADTPSSDDVVPSLAQFHLLGSGAGLLSFRSGRESALNHQHRQTDRFTLDRGESGWFNFSVTRLLALSTLKVTNCAVFSAWFSTGLHHNFAGGERTAFEVCLPKHYAEAVRPSLSKGYLLFSGVPGKAERDAPREEEKEAYDGIR